MRIFFLWAYVEDYCRFQIKLFEFHFLLLFHEHVTRKVLTVALLGFGQWPLIQLYLASRA